MLQAALMIRDQGKTPEIPEETPDFLRSIMKMCWLKEPSKRPDMPVINQLFLSGIDSDDEEGSD